MEERIGLHRTSRHCKRAWCVLILIVVEERIGWWEAQGSESRAIVLILIVVEERIGLMAMSTSSVKKMVLS